LPVPMLDVKAFLKMLQLDLSGRPPVAPVLKVHLRAEPVKPRRARARRPREIVTEFFPLIDAPPPMDRGEVYRVTVPAAAMRTVGLPVAEDRLSDRVQADVLVGTFGKAFGAGGAFVAGCPSLVAWLWNRARSFVFSTGLSPAVASAAAAGIRASRERPELRERVLKAASLFRARLGDLGIEPRGFGHIIPWVIGDARTALRVANLVRAQGIDVLAVRPPSVPEGTARIRLTVTAAHEDEVKRSAMEDIALLLRGAIQARGSVLLKLNVGVGDLGAVTAMLPALSSPTVTSLARGDMHAVEAVVPKRGVNTLIPALKAAGARDILEVPISKIVE